MTSDSGAAAPAQRPRATGAKRSYPGARAIIALMLREMATTYGRSPGGYIWAILEPVGGILLMTAIFSIAFRSPPIGVSFPIFYATGIIPFMAYNSISNKIGASISFSKSLLAYPTVTYLDAILARFVVNFVTEIMVAYILFSCLLYFLDAGNILDGIKIIEAFIMMGVLSFGVGVFNCFLIGLFPVWGSIWRVLSRPMFLISCVFFTFETIPQPYQDYLWYNPLVHVVGMSRSAFYAEYDAVYVTPLYVYGIGLGLTVVGLLLLKRHYRELLIR